MHQDPETAESQPAPPAHGRGWTGFGDVSLRDLLSTFFKYRNFILATVATALVATMLYVWIFPRPYEVEAKILIRFSRDATNPRTTISERGVILPVDNRPDIYSEAELIKSYALVEQVVTELGLDQPSPELPPPGFLPRIKFEIRRVYSWFRELLEEVQILLAFKERLTIRQKAIIEILTGLEVAPVRESSVISVTLRTRFQEGAAVVLNKLVDLYRERQLRVDRNPAIADFMRRQAEEYEGKLESAEEEMTRLKSGMQVSSLSEQISATMGQLLTTEGDVKSTESELAEAEARLAELEEQLGEEPEMTVVQKTLDRNLRVDQYDQQAAALQLQRLQLLSKYQPDHVLIQEIDRQIASLSELRAREPQQVEKSQTTAENQTHVAIRNELLVETRRLESLRARLESAKGRLGYHQNRLRDLREAEVRYNNLARRIELYDGNLKLYSKGAEEVTAAEALSARGISGILVLENAVDPILPAGIRKTYLIAGAVLLAFILSTALAFLYEGLNHAVRTPAETDEAIGGTTIATVPFVPKLLTLESRPEAISTSMGAVTSRLVAMEGAGPLVVFLAAPHRGAGATTLTAALASNLSGSLGQKTVLAALKAPSAGVGGEAENDGADGIRPSRENLVVLPGIELPAHMPTRDVAALTRGLKDRHPDAGFILVDCSASLPPHQRAGVAQGSDAVFVVAEADKTSREVLSRARDLFPGPSFLGAILNKRRYPIPDFVYRHL